MNDPPIEVHRIPLFLERLLQPLGEALEALRKTDQSRLSDTLKLSEVRIETDTTFALFFDTPVGDQIDMWPMVVFSDFKIIRSEWVP